MWLQTKQKLAKESPNPLRSLVCQIMWSQAAVPQLLSKLEDPDLQAEVLSIAELKAFVWGVSCWSLLSHGALHLFAG